MYDVKADAVDELSVVVAGGAVTTKHGGRAGRPTQGDGRWTPAEGTGSRGRYMLLYVTLHSLHSIIVHLIYIYE